MAFYIYNLHPPWILQNSSKYVRCRVDEIVDKWLVSRSNSTVNFVTLPHLSQLLSVSSSPLGTIVSWGGTRKRSSWTKIEHNNEHWPMSPSPRVWLGLVICKTFVIQDTWTAFHLGEGEDNDGNNNAPTYFKCCWEHRQANKIRAINEGMEVLYLNTSLHPPHTWCQSWQITRGWQNNNNIRLQIFSFFLCIFHPTIRRKSEIFRLVKTIFSGLSVKNLMLFTDHIINVGILIVIFLLLLTSSSGCNWH